MSKRVAGKVKRSAGGVLTIAPSHDCHLLCLGEQFPPRLAQGFVLEVLVTMRRHAAPGPEWLVFAGSSPAHWRGLTQWILIGTEVGPEVFNTICDGWREALPDVPFEATELTTPGREPFVEPLFSVEEDGPKLLVPPEDVDAGWSNEVAGVTLRQRGWGWAR